jgi:cytochrome c
MNSKPIVLLGAFLCLAVPASVMADELAVATKAGCIACHAKDKKLVGPAYQEIAKKSKGQADAQAKLAAKVRKGGSGVYGTVPMPPNDDKKISDADLKAVIAWILKM